MQQKSHAGPQQWGQADRHRETAALAEVRQDRPVHVGGSKPPDTSPRGNNPTRSPWQHSRAPLVERFAGAPRRQPQRLPSDSALLWPASAARLLRRLLFLRCGGGEGDLQRPSCFSASLHPPPQTPPLSSRLAALNLTRIST